MNDATTSVYYVMEFEATWPKNLNDLESPLWGIELVGAKNIIPRENKVMQYFFTNVDPDTLEIDGGKMGVISLNRPEKFRLQNECCFANTWEYYNGSTLSFLVSEVQLTTFFQQSFEHDEKFLALNQMMRTMVNMVPDANETDYTKVSSNLFGG